MKILDVILQSEYFTDKPPVLIDVGASGEINPKWKAIAPHCICVAYDADDREFHVTEEDNKLFKKLITFNRIVTASPVDETDFYLTTSPFCSSLLEPNKTKLAPWLFHDLFTVQKINRLPAITLENSLKQANIQYIDWLKTDTQGTDLRLFTSLPVHIQLGILVIEFEPGIIDAYVGEDKLYTVMQEMHQKDFWLSSMELKGVQRLPSLYARKLGTFLSERTIKTSPGWAEVTYLRELHTDSPRQLLLLYIFAILECQYGFALEITDFALHKHSGPIFQDCKKAIWKKIEAEKRKAPLVILKRQINKIFSNLNS